MRGRNDNRGQKKGRRQGGEKKRLDLDRIPMQLPEIQDQLCVGAKLRFITTNAFTGVLSVTPGNLLDAWFIAGTATNCYQLFDFVRVKRVTIRALAVPNISAPNQIGSAATVAVEFYGLATNTIVGGKQRSNTQLGQTMPAYVSVVPDPKSQAAQFQATNLAAMFLIRAVDANANPLAGAVIDVDVVYRNSADVNPAAVTTARAGLQPGTLYYGGLDGATNAATGARSAFLPRA